MVKLRGWSTHSKKHINIQHIKQSYYKYTVYTTMKHKIGNMRAFHNVIKKVQDNYT